MKIIYAQDRSEKLMGIGRSQIPNRIVTRIICSFASEWKHEKLPENQRVSQELFLSMNAMYEKILTFVDHST